MSGQQVVVMGFVLGLTLLLAGPCAALVARALTARRTPGAAIMAPVEALIWRVTGIDPDEEMGWKRYASVLLAVQLAGLLLLYALLRLQHLLPANPGGLPAVPPALAFNAAASFATNTNWQAYVGETTLSRLSQMLGLAVQNFLSAAAGLAAFAALARGFRRQSSGTIGNAWADLVRATTRILLPLSAVLAVLLVSQGVPQTFEPDATVALLEPTTDVAGQAVGTQVVPLGPVASQVAIKQLGTNGGGFFGMNSAHPLENPTPITWLLEAIAILLLPAACALAFGRLVGDARQGRALLAAMLGLFVPLLVLLTVAESAPPPALAGASAPAESGPPSGNLEGKELRFGVAGSAYWAAATTAASNGSVDSMHESFSPLGGLVCLLLMQSGEVVFGGVGSGLYGMVLFALIAVFVAGLMVGRTPEYLGKKIGAHEMKLASLAILVPTVVVLVGTALTVGTSAGRASISQPGPHGFSEALYAWTSAGNNNGSAFAGFVADRTPQLVGLGLAMLAGRLLVMLPVLAIAGSLARRTATPASAGTLPTHGPLFVMLLVSVIVVAALLSFVPALALGPGVEHLRMLGAGP